MSPREFAVAPESFSDSRDLSNMTDGQILKFELDELHFRDTRDMAGLLEFVLHKLLYPLGFDVRVHRSVEKMTYEFLVRKRPAPPVCKPPEIPMSMYSACDPVATSTTVAALAKKASDESLSAMVHAGLTDYAKKFLDAPPVLDKAKFKEVCDAALKTGATKPPPFPKPEEPAPAYEDYEIVLED